MNPGQFIVEPNALQLREINSLLDSKELRFSIDAVLRVSAATEAYAGTSQRRGHGKKVISTSEWAG